MGQPDHSPDDLDHRLEAAFARQRRGDIAFADRVYREVLSRCPDHPRALHYLGLIAQQRRNSDLARRLLHRSIEIDPTDVRVHNHLGDIYAGLNDGRAAEACFERGLQIDPEHFGTLNNLANVIATRDLPRAISLYERALRVRPNAVHVVLNLAQALEQYHAYDEALKLYTHAIALDPRNFQAHYRLGILLEQRGIFARALAQYLIVQQIEPRHAGSLASILAMRDYLPSPPMVRRAEGFLDAPGARDEDRIRLHHALGRHYERAGNLQRAFSEFFNAKELFRHTRPAFDIDTVRNAMARTRQAFGDEVLSTYAPPIANLPRPIFIVGIPRSGTTLIEQILASHPQVFGGGELQGIPQLVGLMGSAYPECMAAKAPNELGELAAAYFGTIRLADTNAARVTDKLPLNSLHLGLIAKLFPNSHIVHCRRDPLDLAISCFTELFHIENDFTTNFEDFGHYFLEHERLMAHWRAVLPIPIHEVRYEDMVSKPEATIRALIRHCALDWDPACLAFQKTDRTIQTPSRWQVRQPIYQSSVGRWRHYRIHMHSLIQFLHDCGYEYPNERY
ncbi:MAG: tetratricopeptide repeat-containing sulfotransferase family protein [Steroidobacteraceae bacterium]